MVNFTTGRCCCLPSAPSSISRPLLPLACCAALNISPARSHSPTPKLRAVKRSRTRFSLPDSALACVQAAAWPASCPCGWRALPLTLCRQGYGTQLRLYAVEWAACSCWLCCCPIICMRRIIQSGMEAAVERERACAALPAAAVAV